MRLQNIKSELNKRLFNPNLTVLQWDTVTSEVCHAVGMTKLVMQLICNTLWVGQKTVWDSKTKTNFCPKIVVFLKKRSSLEINLRFLIFFVPKSWCSLLSKKKVTTKKFVGRRPKSSLFVGRRRLEKHCNKEINQITIKSQPK